MNPDVAVPVNWFLVVVLLGIAAAWIGVWNHPSAMRRIAARYLARAEALDRSRSVFENSLRRWHRQLRIPEANTTELLPDKPWPRSAIRSNDV
jgi:hypothetical protein